jgi:hypothetical protein
MVSFQGFHRCEKHRVPAVAGNDAGKAAVKAEARDRGVDWKDVVSAMVELRAGDPDKS